ncbi:MAG: M20/M25/M40 family metallo-hydrolase, partial [Ilumatobacteraceae bacterium]
MLADLEYLVSIESPSHNVEAITRSASAVGDVIERRLGHRADIVESVAGPHVHARFGPSSKVLIVGHHDTVFPIGALDARPFAVTDGRATGPGVFDMKAGIVLAVHALSQLDDLDGIELLITSDEEVGSRASRDLIEERALACGAVLVMEPSADGGALKTARKGTGTFEVIVHGKAAHAGLEPEKGINSLVAAAQLITRIATFGDPEKGTTVTPTVATAGTADNVVPALTKVRVDARVNVAGEKERVEHLMATLASD